jgi:hypothetical protein
MQIQRQWPDYQAKEMQLVGFDSRSLIVVAIVPLLLSAVLLVLVVPLHFPYFHHYCPLNTSIAIAVVHTFLKRNAGQWFESY